MTEFSFYKKADKTKGNFDDVRNIVRSIELMKLRQERDRVSVLRSKKRSVTALQGLKFMWRYSESGVSS